MPGSDHETTLARQWELLRNHLPTRPPGRSSKDLRDRLEAAGHNVTKRTIERDMAELSRIFPIDRNENGIPYGWHWIESARFDVLGMDLSEAVSLGLMEDVLRQIMPPAFLSALEGKFSMAKEKLAALPKIPHARWADLVRYVPPGLPFIPPVVAPGVLAAIQEALLQQRQLTVIYQSAGADTGKELTLHPLSLIQQGTRSYLVATAFDYEKPLLYALHRMASAVTLDESAKRPNGFSLDAYLATGAAQFGTGKSITLKARVTDELAFLLNETPISKDQKITTRSGVHTLTATMQESWQLDFWIRSQGAAITVMKPVALRKHIIASLEETLSNYT
ncbi:MAG: helix-turn-helix transcriptional regulator [Luteolibacter sp.]